MEEKQIDKKISFKQLIRISWFSFKLQVKGHEVSKNDEQNKVV